MDEPNNDGFSKDKTFTTVYNIVKLRAWVESDLGIGLEDVMSITADAITYDDWQMEEIGKAFNAIYSIVNNLNKQALELQKEWESEDQ